MDLRSVPGRPARRRSPDPGTDPPSRHRLLPSADRTGPVLAIPSVIPLRPFPEGGPGCNGHDQEEGTVRGALLLLVPIVTLGACNRATRAVLPAPSRDVVTVDGAGRGAAAGPRSLRVPPGHYPPPGQCRVWHPGRPPGQQPPPANCASLAGRVPAGAFLLYNNREWDSRYDWRAAERRTPGSVPEVVLRVIGSAAGGR